MLRIAAISMAVVFASAALGQSKAAITSSAGFVSGVNTTTATGSWSGITGAAQTATISYTHNLQASGQSNTNGAPTEFKAVNAAGLFGPKIFNGDHASINGETGTALVAVDGHSYFSNPGSTGAPVYYQASWTSTTQSSGDGSASNGTYDPWVVHNSDLVNDLGLTPGGTATLYYQTGIGGGYSSSSGFDLAPGGNGFYSFDASASRNGNTLNFFSVTDSSTTGLSTTFNTYANFSVYLLGSDAHTNSATPGDRRANAVTQITSAAQLLSIVQGDLNPDGSLSDNLDFGIYYDNVTLAPGYDPNGVTIAWHTDTTVGVNAVPEPASMAVLGLGLLFCLRRRSA